MLQFGYSLIRYSKCWEKMCTKVMTVLFRVKQQLPNRYITSGKIKLNKGQPTAPHINFHKLLKILDWNLVIGIADICISNVIVWGSFTVDFPWKSKIPALASWMKNEDWLHCHWSLKAQHSHCTALETFLTLWNLKMKLGVLFMLLHWTTITMDQITASDRAEYKPPPQTCIDFLNVLTIQ